MNNIRWKCIIGGVSYQRKAWLARLLPGAWVHAWVYGYYALQLPVAKDAISDEHFCSRIQHNMVPALNLSRSLAVRRTVIKKGTRWKKNVRHRLFRTALYYRVYRVYWEYILYCIIYLIFCIVHSWPLSKFIYDHFQSIMENRKICIHIIGGMGLIIVPRGYMETIKLYRNEIINSEVFRKDGQNSFQILLLKGMRQRKNGKLRFKLKRKNNTTIFL